MVKKTTLPSVRKHVMLYQEDWDYLEQHYGPGSPRPDVGVSQAIRSVIHQRVLGLRAEEARAVDALRAKVVVPMQADGVKL